MLKDFYVIGYFTKPKNRVLTALENTADEKHLTILQRFTMDDSHVDSFSTSLSEVLNAMKSDGVNEYAVDTIRSDEFVSPMGRTPVQIVEKTDAIVRLHNESLEIADNLSAIFQNRAFSGEGYNPHISHTDEKVSTRLSHVALTTYQDVPFKIEIKVLFDLNGNVVSDAELESAA